MSDLGLWLGELAVFDATVAAVPFLWELATADSPRSRRPHSRAPRGGR
ncbi:hypothetical protein AB4039_18505 [Streptomyces sp. M-16]